MLLIRRLHLAEGESMRSIARAVGDFQDTVAKAVRNSVLPRSISGLPLRTVLAYSVVEPRIRCIC